MSEREVKFIAEEIDFDNPPEEHKAYVAWVKTLYERADGVLVELTDERHTITSIMLIGIVIARKMLYWTRAMADDPVDAEESTALKRIAMRLCENITFTLEMPALPQAIIFLEAAQVLVSGKLAEWFREQSRIKDEEGVN